MALENLSRSARILSAVLRCYAAGISLPDTRKTLAAEIGGTADSYLGTADPIYYRLVGEANPISTGTRAAVRKDGRPSAAFLAALLKRRNSGVRWNVLAASAGATLGRKVSEREAKALYVAAGGDLGTSYAGRGTRVGAPGTYEDDAAAVRGGEATAE